MSTLRHRRSRLRGRRTAGYGYKKKHRGKGSKGGKGMSGTGKKAGQKHTYVLRYFPEGYFGKKGFHPEKNTGLKLKQINLDEIEEHLPKFIKEGIAKKSGNIIEINLKGYKILSRGKIKEKVKIIASAFSAKAEEKLKENESIAEKI